MNRIIHKDYYYLLYKLKNSSSLWIVDKSVNKNDLLERIKDFYSEKEVYYIVSKKYSNDYIKNILDSKFIRFKTFKVDNKCKFIYNTE